MAGNANKDMRRIGTSRERNGVLIFHPYLGSHETAFTMRCWLLGLSIYIYQIEIGLQSFCLNFLLAFVVPALPRVSHSIARC